MIHTIRLKSLRILQYAYDLFHEYKAKNTAYRHDNDGHREVKHLLSISIGRCGQADGGIGDVIGHLGHSLASLLPIILCSYI